MRNPVLWLVIFLSACTALPQAPVMRPALSANFALNGRIAINHRGERHSAGLRWTHTAQSDEMLLLTPLGQTAARVFCDAGHATLDNGDKHYQADDVESLMQQALGWYLPVEGLHHWVLGLAEMATPAETERDEHGRVAVLRQDGWEIRYLRYADNRPDSLPTRMQLVHHGLQLQLLIDEWEIP